MIGVSLTPPIMGRGTQAVYRTWVTAVIALHKAFYKIIRIPRASTSELA